MLTVLLYICICVVHFFSLIITITLQGRVRVSHKETEAQRSLFALSKKNLVSKPRLKPEFEPKACICPFYQLVASSWVSCIHKLDKFYRFVLMATSHFFLTSPYLMLHVQVK